MRPLKLACADSSFPQLSHDMSLAVIRDLGIEAADVCVFAGYRNNTPEVVLSDPGQTADQIGQRLAAHGLAVSDVFAILSDPYTELAVNHPEEAVRAEALSQFGRLLDFADRLDAPGISILPGYGFDGVEQADGIALSAAELQRRAELARERGLALSFEPHVGSIAETVDATAELLDQAPDVTVALDLSHFVSEGAAQADADVLLPRTRHVHLRQARPGVIQERASHGTIDFAALLSGLAAAGYEGWLALEYQWEADTGEWDGVDCIGETVSLRDILLAAHGSPSAS